MLGLNFFLKEIDRANSITLNTGNREKKWNEVVIITRTDNLAKIEQIEKELEQKLAKRRLLHPAPDPSKKRPKTHYYHNKNKKNNPSTD